KLISNWLILRCFACFSTNLLLSKTPRHILAQTNNKTEILCELKTEHAGVYWYRWSQEKQNFEFLVFSNPFGKAIYGANISEAKFSVPGASSRSSYSLHISKLHASDNGTYYCSISQSSQLLLGSGTQLSVGKHLPPEIPFDFLTGFYQLGTYLCAKQRMKNRVEIQHDQGQSNLKLNTNRCFEITQALLGIFFFSFSTHDKTNSLLSSFSLSLL
uniref:Ig-like domain-containing protein n=1 Tax=Buteo japonicus TaxID=224669 RepID=A0A8C0HEH5_9AVES